MEHPEGMSSPKGFIVLENLIPRDRSKLRPNARILRKLERDHCSVCKEN
jgi:hypothetical protein